MSEFFTPDKKIVLDFSPDALNILNQLLKQTNDMPGDLFRKAIALDKAAVDAHQQGKAVGIAATPESLETEFVGF